MTSRHFEGTPVLAAGSYLTPDRPVRHGWIVTTGFLSGTGQLEFNMSDRLLDKIQPSSPNQSAVTEK
jgi:hypothetical protein